MLEAECLHKLLVSPRELRVAVGIESLDVGRDGFELRLNRSPVLRIALDCELGQLCAQIADSTKCKYRNGLEKGGL